ncbi:hypothetical protein [Rhodothermus marinus]|uniref:hypothetical protein n=1 Tax=Rhodothermus marinus TaxID=29549 RepID=UPI001FB22BE6|nr:hypothetical protein [Rhodothermus marinus]
MELSLLNLLLVLVAAWLGGLLATRWGIRRCWGSCWPACCWGRRCWASCTEARRWPWWGSWAFCS